MDRWGPVAYPPWAVPQPLLTAPRSPTALTEAAQPHPIHSQQARRHRQRVRGRPSGRAGAKRAPCADTSQPPRSRSDGCVQVVVGRWMAREGAPSPCATHRTRVVPRAVGCQWRRKWRRGGVDAGLAAAAPRDGSRANTYVLYRQVSRFQAPSSPLPTNCLPTVSADHRSSGLDICPSTCHRALDDLSMGRK